MKKKLLMILPLALMLLVASCNKNQKAVKTLDGDWTLVKQDGEAVPADEAPVYKFSNCKLKSDEYCDLDVVDADGEVESITYSVTDDGETLVLRFEEDGAAFDIENKILELTKDKLVMEFNFFGTTELEFSK